VNDEELSQAVLEQLSARGATVAHLAAVMSEPVDRVVAVVHELAGEGRVFGGPDYWRAPGARESAVS
jgi:hypothetical protein